MLTGYKVLRQVSSSYLQRGTHFIAAQGFLTSILTLKPRKRGFFESIGHGAYMKKEREDTIPCITSLCCYKILPPDLEKVNTTLGIGSFYLAALLHEWCSLPLTPCLHT